MGMDIGRGNLSRLVVAVDLLPLRPGGENGGIKPAIFTLLPAVRAEAPDKLVFVFLTNSASHAQVRDMAGPNDILICAREELRHPYDALDPRTNEFKLAPAPDKLVQAIGTDLLYCPFGATTFHVPGTPTIALIADLLHRDYPFTLTEQQIDEREAYIQKTVHDSTLLQCISRSGMERVTEHYQVQGDRLFYTYLPIHARLEQTGADSTEPKNAITERPFFFYPANLWLHKNHEVLLVSYARYWHETGKEAWDLVLTFHEEARAGYLRSLARTLGVAGRVHFMGFQNEADLHRLWLRAGALVFPSLHEGFGIPLLEAMHYGVPIITGEGFALKEIAGDACYLIDPRKPASLSEALGEVSQDEECRARLIRSGWLRLELFQVKAAAHTLLEAFCSVVRKEDDLPRKPRYSCVPPILAVPTPGSADRWKIDIQFQSQSSFGKCAIYLDDWPFASFGPATRAEHTFSFVCRPAGRTLALRVARGSNANGRSSPDAGGISITRIVASDAGGRRILLFEQSHSSRLS
ncbi:MAG: hypothetical protein DLM73_01450 [Chthoniobacterales bacterium]|nr:MAG: hypothetical protein DLM73_01450 [Chthoniobacterales bacterium]